MKSINYIAIMALVILFAGAFGNSFGSVLYDAITYNNHTVDGDFNVTGAVVLGTGLNAFYVVNPAVNCSDGYARTGTGANLADVYCTKFQQPVMANGEGLVGYWAMEMGRGEVAYDSTNYSNDGTLNENMTWTTGRFGSALDGTANKSYVDITSFSGYPDGNEITMSMWIKVNAHESWQELNGYNWDSSYMRMDANERISFSPKNTTSFTSAVTYPTALDIDKWYHVAAICNGTHVYMYVNGVIGSNVELFSGTLSTSTNFRIGSRGTTNSFNGMIDEFKIWNRSVTSEEIQAEYTLGQASHSVTGHLLARDVPYETKQRYYNSTGDICCCSFVNATGVWIQTSDVSLCG